MLLDRHSGLRIARLTAAYCIMYGTDRLQNLIFEHEVGNHQNQDNCREDRNQKPPEHDGRPPIDSRPIHTYQNGAAIKWN